MKEKTKLEAALDELLSGKSTEEMVGPEGLLKQLTKAVLERAMGAELTQHLGYERVNHPDAAAATTATGRAGKRCRATLARSK
jgi:transposase-like protein